MAMLVEFRKPTEPEDEREGEKKERVEQPLDNVDFRLPRVKMIDGKEFKLRPSGKGREFIAGRHLANFPVVFERRLQDEALEAYTIRRIPETEFIEISYYSESSAADLKNHCSVKLTKKELKEAGWVEDSFLRDHGGH